MNTSNSHIAYVVARVRYVSAIRVAFTQPLEMAGDMYSARWQRGSLIVAATFIEYVCPRVGGVWPCVRVRDVSIAYTLSHYTFLGASYTC